MKTVKIILVILMSATFFSCNRNVVKTKDEILQTDFFGIPVVYDVRSADLIDTKKIITDFSIAFLKQNKAALDSIVTNDFVWYLHEGFQSPSGQVINGTTEMLKVLANRKSQWSQVVYSDFTVFSTKTLITQTYKIKWIDAKTGAFEANGVDLYTIRDKKIAIKDSYWKQISK